MLTTSSQYQSAVVAGTRQSTANIIFGVYDVTAKDDATPSANTSQPFTDPDQVNNPVTVPQFNAATFEDDYFRLDGSFVLMPDDVSTLDNLGWWSEVQSDDTGVFTPLVPVMTIDFVSPHESLGIVLTFDQSGKSFCTKFTISWYDGVTLLDTDVVIDNDKLTYVSETPVSGYDKVVIEFFETDEPYRYARLLSVDYGIQQEYDGDTIVEASVLEEVDPSLNLISINKLKFTVLNEDQKLNPLNPEGIFQFLQARQPIVAKSGLAIAPNSFEYVDMGTFYLSDWGNVSGITATLEATDAIGVLDRTTYYSSPFWVDEPLANVLDHIITDASDFSYSIDASLLSEVVNGYIPVKSHREALQDLARAVGAVVNVNRLGVIEFTVVQYATSVWDVDFDTILGLPKPKQQQLISSVDVEEIEYNLQSSQTIHESTYDYTGQQEIIINYDQVPAINISVAVVGAAVVDTQANSATSSILKITGSGAFTLTITGQPYEAVSKVFRTTLGTLPVGEIPQVATVDVNYLIAKQGLALVVGQTALDYYQRRILQRFEYFDNPALQAGDCILLSDMFGNTSKTVIESQDITFAPRLIGTLEVVG